MPKRFKIIAEITGIIERRAGCAAVSGLTSQARVRPAFDETGAKAEAGLGHPFFLDQHRRLRDRALFDLAIDSKLRGCDVASALARPSACGGAMCARDVCQGESARMMD
jgi:hypothetical protein